MPAPTILQLRHFFDSAPATAEHRLPAIRTFGQPGDLPAWLELRKRAFAQETPAGRLWTELDFQREFVQKPWWNPNRIWLVDDPQHRGRLAGAIAMALRGLQPELRPAIHWLMVDPDCRSRGLGERLIATLEGAAWRDGYREVVLETHANWRAAVRLYRKLGYRDFNSDG